MSESCLSSVTKPPPMRAYRKGQCFIIKANHFRQSQTPRSVSVWLLYTFSNLPSVSWSELWREQKRTSNAWEKDSQGILIHLPFSVCGHSFKFSFVYSALFCLMGLRRQRKICWYIKKTDFAYRHSVQQITANHFQKKKKKQAFIAIFKRSQTPTLL